MSELQDLKKDIRDIKIKLDNHLEHILPKIAEIETHVKYLRKFFWVVATSSIGGLLAGVFNLLLK